MVRKISLSIAALFFTTQLIAVELPPSPPVADAPGATSSSSSLSVGTSYSFVSAPFDGDMDIATLVSAGCTVNVYDDTATWFVQKTSGSAKAGQAVVVKCTSASTVSFSPTLNTTAFSMATNISSVGKGSIPSTHQAYVLGNKFAVVGTPVATTIGAVVTAGASNVLYWDGSTWNTGSTSSSTTVLPAGSSFYIQVQQ